MRTLVLRTTVTLEPSDEAFLLANDEADGRIAAGGIRATDGLAVRRLLDQELLRCPENCNSLYLITEKGRRTIEALRGKL